MTYWWHVFCVNHWYDVAAEMLRCFRRAEAPNPIHVELIGSAADQYEIESLAGLMGQHLVVARHLENTYEYPTLHALWAYCQEHDGLVSYVHTKGVTSASPTYTKWRWMMEENIILRWRERAEDLREHDAVGCALRMEWPGLAGEWPHFAGNWWGARAEYVRRVAEPRISRDRFEYERWLLSARPLPRVKTLVSAAGQPHLSYYYGRHGQPYRDMLASE
jgi:hypothetical protein